MSSFDDEGPTLEKMVPNGLQNGAQNQAKSITNGGLGEALLPNGSPWGAQESFRVTFGADLE